MAHLLPLGKAHHCIGVLKPINPYLHAALARQVEVTGQLHVDSESCVELGSPAYEDVSPGESQSTWLEHVAGDLAVVNQLQVPGQIDGCLVLIADCALIHLKHRRGDLQRFRVPCAVRIQLHSAAESHLGLLRLHQAPIYDGHPAGDAQPRLGEQIALFGQAHPVLGQHTDPRFRWLG